MESISSILSGFLSKVSLPSVGVIDVIEIFLISFSYTSLWYGLSLQEPILC